MMSEKPVYTRDDNSAHLQIKPRLLFGDACLP